MSLNHLIATDLADILAEIGVDVVIRFKGAPYKTVKGLFIPFDEVVSPYEGEHVVTKPAVVFVENDGEGITREHTMEPGEYGEMKVYGDPIRGAGQIKFHLMRR